MKKELKTQVIKAASLEEKVFNQLAADSLASRWLTLLLCSLILGSKLVITCNTEMQIILPRHSNK
jgi:hypothetical protein